MNSNAWAPRWKKHNFAPQISGQGNPWSPKNSDRHGDESDYPAVAIRVPEHLQYWTTAASRGALKIVAPDQSVPARLGLTRPADAAAWSVEAIPIDAPWGVKIFVFFPGLVQFLFLSAQPRLGSFRSRCSRRPARCLYHACSRCPASGRAVPHLIARAFRAQQLYRHSLAVTVSQTSLLARCLLVDQFISILSGTLARRPSLLSSLRKSHGRHVRGCI